MPGKLGTFGGVFTPSLLTILGVIMYLRLPWVVGNAGLWGTLGILAAAHVVSIATGLSVSSIATDKKVGTGGSYYILSRSFGLPIGGAIGLALFFGISFAASLHTVGFSESVLSALDITPTANAIRVAGTITLFCVAATVFISTSLAIKTQYLILFLVFGSLIAIFLGSSHTSAPQLEAHAESPGFGILFGIFFPAVTGLTMGVEMSGDLKDPKRSIPRGTMGAVFVSFAVYLVLVLWSVYRLDAEALRKDPEVLQHTSLWEPAVIAGIWGATLSSALGAIMGAPRILQAMSIDRITPKAFAAGRGATNEPHRALFLAFAIAECGILIAELDVIARVVSAVFLALYGAINVTCAIQSWANPDFRPRFKIPKLVSIAGAITAFVLMIQLDLLATVGATALLLGLYAWLARRQLRLEGGNTWQGIWSTIARVALHRLHKAPVDAASWRPNVLLFDEAGHPSHGTMRDFAATLASGNGMVTDFALARPSDREAQPTPRVGIFDVRIETTTPLETVASICEHHGFAGAQPNTLLLPWRRHTDDPTGFVHAVKVAAGRGLSVLLVEEPRTPQRAARPRMDIWWSPESGNLPLSVALARFITRAPEWERAEINFLIAGDGGDGDHVLRAKATHYFEAHRVEAKVRVIVRPPDEDFYDLICNESRPAALVLVGLPGEIATLDNSTLERLDRVAALPGGIVIMRASDGFPPVLVVPRLSKPHAPGRDSQPILELSPSDVELELVLPEHRELAATATAIAQHTRGQIEALHGRLLAVCTSYLELCDGASEAVAKRAEALMQAARDKDPMQRRRLAHKATSAYMASANDALGRLAETEVNAQATLLAEQLTAFGRGEAILPAAVPAVIRIERPRSDFRALKTDSGALKRWKRRRRWLNFYRRSVGQSIAIGALAERAHTRIACDQVVQIVARFSTATHDLAVEVGRVLASEEWRLHAEVSGATIEDPEALVTRIRESLTKTQRRLEAVRDHTRQRLAEDRIALDAAAFGELQKLAADLDLVQAPLLARSARPTKQDAEALAALPAAADTWRDSQLALLRRIRIAVQLARFHDKLTTIGVRHVEEIVASVRESSHVVCTQVRAALAKPKQALAPIRDEHHFDPADALDRFTRVVAAATAELPETEVLLTDIAAAALVRGDTTIETASVAVRSGVQAIIEADLLHRVTSEAVRFADADARAWAVARDASALFAGGSVRTSREDEALSEAALRRDAIARLDETFVSLREAEVAYERAILDGLEALAGAIAPDGLCAALDAHNIHARDRERPSKLRAILDRAMTGVRNLAARAVYRRSAGIVYAKETQIERERSVAHTLRALATKSSASPAVLDALPLYYRNLFSGSINVNEALIIGRAEQVKAGALALSGRHGLRSVLVTGERGSGKTTVCQQIANSASQPVHWVSAPAEGAATRAAVVAALEATLGANGPPTRLLARLPEGSVIVFDDLDLWWERRPGGLEAIDEIIDLVGQHGERLAFVLAAGESALRVLGTLRPLAAIAHDQVHCRPLAARELEEVVLARHASSGLRVKVGARDAFGAWTRARLFDAHFAFSLGNVGYALRSWVAHIDEVADDGLAIRIPTQLDWDAIDDLSSEHVAALIELLLHKAASPDKLARLTGSSPAQMRSVLAELTAFGLAVQNRRQLAQLNPAVQVPFAAWLARKELV